MHQGYSALAVTRYRPIKVGEVGGQARTPAQDSCSHVPGFAVGAWAPTGQTLVAGQSSAASSEPLGTPCPPPANLSPRWTSRLVTVTGADCSFPGGGVVCRVPEHGRALSACCLFLLPSQFSPVASSLKLGKWTVVICVEVGVGGSPGRGPGPSPPGGACPHLHSPLLPTLLPLEVAAF